MNNGTKIVVVCRRPGYASGGFTFSKFEELHSWLSTLKSLGQGQGGLWLYTLAKDGQVAPTPNARVDLEMKSSFHDYHLAREVAIATGLLRIRGLSETLTRDPAAVSAFARQLDARIPVAAG